MNIEGREGLSHKTTWAVTRYANAEDAKVDRVYSDEEALALFGVKQQTAIENNILVNTGINEAWKLICGGTATAFNNANAYLGVGDNDGTDAEDPTDTDLKASTNKVRVAMDVSYPTYGTSQLATWRATFDGSTANFAWQEFAVFNASTAGVMLNRKVSDQGTKTSGQTWQLTLSITLS
jgi:hypothetical protein